mgnify:CR=1 FL=1|jgi:hypothetical protein|nr:MAG TPA: hypothetical protein [Caudoviricetes sp.]
MIFPTGTNSATFSVIDSAPVIYTFTKAKPKKIFFDISSTDYSFRIKINDSVNNNPLFHLSRQEHFSISFPITVDKIEITTTSTDSALMTLFIEEWGN